MIVIGRNWLSLEFIIFRMQQQWQWNKVQYEWEKAENNNNHRNERRRKNDDWEKELNWEVWKQFMEQHVK